MVKINQVLKFLSSINPNLTPARVCFNNYLSYFCDANDTLTRPILESFFSHSMDYAHWIQNRANLTQEIKAILEGVQKLAPLEIDFSQIRWPQEIQVLEVESSNDWVELVQNYVKSQITTEAKFRLIHEESIKRLIVIILQADGAIEVRQFDRKFIINNGQLTPLKKEICLYYTAELELNPARKQMIEVAPFVTAQFKVSGEKMTGCLLRGYLGQKFFELRGEPMTAYPKLFYSVKRIESFFIDRGTDSFYNGLVQSLERTNALVRVNDPEAIRDSLNTLSQAQNAIEYVFMGDKLLNLLVRDLQHNLQNRRPVQGIVAAVEAPLSTVTEALTWAKSNQSDLSPLRNQANPPTSISASPMNRNSLNRQPMVRSLELDSTN